MIEIMVSLSSPVGPKVRPTKIRSRLVLMILGTLIPILAFSGFMLVAFNRQTRHATERGLVETARALSRDSGYRHTPGHPHKDLRALLHHQRVRQGHRPSLQNS